MLAEVLEDRRLLSAGALNVALISDAVSQAEQIRLAAADDTIAIVYHADTLTTDGLADLVASVSAAHEGARIGHLGIVTHGGPGEVAIGKSDDLSLATMPNQSAALERLRSVLTSEATSQGAAPNYPVGWGSEDPRAVVSVSDSWPISDPFAILTSPWDPNGLVGDAALGIAFDFGDIAPGQIVTGPIHRCSLPRRRPPMLCLEPRLDRRRISN